MRRNQPSFPSSAVLALTLASASLAADAPTAPPIDTTFLGQSAATGGFNLGRPTAIEVAPDGKAVLFLRSGARTFVRDLYELDVATGQERVLLTAEQILKGAAEKLTAEELARRERTRSTARGIAGYELSRDGRQLLVPLSGRLYLVDRASKATVELAGSAGFPIDPRLSPDASKVAVVRDGDLYVVDIAGHRETRLTTTASDTLSNATAEFVAQEEMDRREGYWWSPDSRFIAYQETDETDVELLHIADPAHPEKAPNTFRYPRPGKNNAAVRLGVIPAGGGATVWVDWDRTSFPYLAQVTWQPNAPLTIVVQNREQTAEQVYAVDAATGKPTALLTETDAAWLNLDPAMPRWLPDGQTFLWSSERGGAWQLEQRARDGQLLRTLTARDFGYRGLVGLDEKRLEAVVAASADVLEGHLWRLPLAIPKSRARAGALPVAVQLTKEPGNHGAFMGASSDTWVLAQGGLDGPRRLLAVNRDGKQLAELVSVAEASPLSPNLDFTTVDVTRDGAALTLNALVIRPHGFDPKLRYPVLVSVYGGPHAQTVRKSWGYLREQWAADQGFIVVLLDGRGTPNRGRAFERAIRGDFIGPGLADQADGVQALGRQVPQMDMHRVGIYGWSFGGYFSAMAVMQRPDVYQAGVAGAPVVDWQDYDTHYTERYVGLPDAHPEAYAKSSVLTYAAKLSRPLLLIHGTADDNVYFMHSIKLADALLRAGVDFDFLPLAGFTHMVAEPSVVERENARILRFFRQHLGTPQPAE
jgi:dipeptidyl-peptidase-4